MSNRLSAPEFNFATKYVVDYSFVTELLWIRHEQPTTGLTIYDYTTQTCNRFKDLIDKHHTRSSLESLPPALQQFDDQTEQKMSKKNTPG
jgi:hypothetical protein